VSTVADAVWIRVVSPFGLAKQRRRGGRSLYQKVDESGGLHAEQEAVIIVATTVP
jgi:hypothetical protein